MQLFRVIVLMLLVNIVSGQTIATQRKIIGPFRHGIVKEVATAKQVIHPGIELYLRSLVDTANFQGVALIVKGNKIIHKSVYGNSSREENKPIGFKTQYLLGSLSKSFVSIAIMQLVEEGRLDLFAPLAKYLPALREDLAKGLNLHLLLKHQSGLATNFEDVVKYQLVEPTPMELLGFINKTKRRNEPGVKFEISSLNFMLLGLVIEQVTGKTYEAYMKENLFRPLQLSHTGISHLFQPPVNKANGYKLIDGKVRRIEDIVSYAYATADMYSTVEDLFAWGYALQHALIVSRPSLDNLFNGGVKREGNYGYGFRTQSYLRPETFSEAGKLIRHGGVMNGFCANYHYYDKDDLTIILLNNYRNLRILNITYNLKEIVYGYQPGQRKNKYNE